ncbi:DUF4124 domain-containing protein [Cellvibrio mixtus]|uniref:DUF4124 domain-containing protein n=1 Tax=Cellvibrio mixtus TaxID=39650 RepID=UPI000586DF6F|nr:DUF4124 domain-containing protein [Cellvibrio mixtus]
MRFIFKSLIILVIVLGVGNYLVYLKTGQFPLAKVRENYNGDWLAAVKETFSSGDLFAEAKKTVDGLTQDDAAKPAPTKVYKWTDANGQVHYGDKPDSVGAEQVEVKIQNAISPPDQDATQTNTQKSVTSGMQTPLEKARAAADKMQTRTLPEEAN